MRHWKGGVAEWLKATVLKTVDGRLSVSSNLTSSAKFKTKPLICKGFFRLQFAVYKLVYKSAVAQNQRLTSFTTIYMVLAANQENFYKTC